MDANMAMALIISFSPEVGVSRNEQPVMSIITRQGKTIIARYPVARTTISYWTVQ